MGKIFGILFMVVAIWVALEVYTQGARNAFGGALSFLSGEDQQPTEDHEWAGEKASTAVEQAYRKQEDRYRQLED
jgi:hypothetical protein